MIHRKNAQIATRLTRSLAIFSVLLAMAVTPGCVELGIIIPIGTPNTPTDNGDPSNPDNPDPNPDPNNPTSPPTVSLSVSNPTPQLDEQVTLTCRVTSGDETNAAFDFSASPQPATRLSISSSSGRATFIVTQSDINIAFRFTCSVTTDGGQSPASSSRTVTPTGT